MRAQWQPSEYVGYLCDCRSTLWLTMLPRRAPSTIARAARMLRPMPAMPRKNTTYVVGPSGSFFVRMYQRAASGASFVACIFSRSMHAMSVSLSVLALGDATIRPLEWSNFDSVTLRYVRSLGLLDDVQRAKRLHNFVRSPESWVSGCRR